jgi:hypothetical protein
MKTVVAEIRSGQPGKCGCLYWASEDAGSAEADVIKQDQNEIRRAVRRLRLRGPIGNRLIARRADVAIEGGIGFRQASLRQHRGGYSY